MIILSRLLFNRIKINLRTRLKSTKTDDFTRKETVDQLKFIEELNRLKSKDLTKIFNDEQKTRFFQLKRSLGGKFHSFEQIQNQNQLKFNFDQFSDFISQIIERQNSSKEIRIQIEPRLSLKKFSEINNVLAIDCSLTYLNYTLVQYNSNDQLFQVQQWNSFPMKFDRKYRFLNVFHELKEKFVEIPFDSSKIILLDQVHYRFSNLRLASYLSHIQQIRAIFNTLVHCQSMKTDDQTIYHISSRDVFNYFGLLVGNEQSSSEFFLTNLIFQNSKEKIYPNIEIDHQLKTQFYQTHQGQREPMAQCLLRAIAFCQYVQQKLDLSK